MVEAARPRLYSGERQFENFCRMADFFPTATLAPSSRPRPFSEGPSLTLPDSYVFEGESRSLDALLTATDTSALMVLQNGAVRHETYLLTGGPQVRWTSWSVAKSFVSALVGIAIEEGAIDSVDAPISDYAPRLRGSAYDGVAIRHVLQMSSGARWNEDYSDPESDVNRLGAVMAGHETLDDFVSAIVRDREPGSLCQYNSADTQALGMLLRGATGEALSAYMQHTLIEPLGMQDPGYWLTDHDGVEMVLGGLNLTARDYARIGELFRNGGRVGDQQIVPESWVRDSTRVQAPHLAPGQVIVGGHEFAFGYGYQWWLPAGDRGDYSAIGVYNQFVYVDPRTRATIVKLSANPRYGTSPYERDNRDEENLVMLQSIAQRLEQEAAQA